MSSQQQPHPSQQMPMQNPRMMASRNGAFYGMHSSRQVLMQQPMSQQQRMVSQQPRYVIARPPPQNNQTPPNNQQMHASPPNMIQRHDGIVVSMSSGNQYYQQQPNQNPPMHQMNRNQPRTIQPGQQQIQMIQQQGTPPNQLNYNISSPYTPPQNPSTPQNQQYSSQHYNQQPSTPQHQRIQQQTVQRPLTPQQVGSPVQRKNTPVMVKTNSIQDMNDSGSQSQQGHYVVQAAVPVSGYNVHTSIIQGNDGQQQDGSFNNTQTTRPGNFQIRHPVNQRPVQYTNQPGNNPALVRYSYPTGQQIQPVVIQQQPQQPKILRPAVTTGDRTQFIQVVRSESDLPGQTTYRIPNNEQSYVVTSQPNVFYRTAAPQQPNSAIRQALGHDYSQQIQTSQAPVIIQSIDNSSGQVMYKMPRQTSADSYDSGSYVQSVTATVETNEFAAEQQNNLDDDTSSEMPVGQDEASPAKKPKLTPKSGKSASVGKQVKSKPKKVATKSIANKTILTGSDFNNEETTNGTSSAKPLITKDILEQAARSINQNLTLEEDAKTGVMMYMERFVTRLINETGRAANIRKSKQVQTKDIEFALRTKFGINPPNTASAAAISSKFGK